MKRTILALGLTLSGLLTGAAHAQLTRPDGPGPFPAVVLMHGCGGVLPLYSDWATFFRDHGYVTLVVDSFGPRGLGNICGNGAPMVQGRIEDAYRALDQLKALPFVDGQRVALMGWSHGAWTALEAVAEGHPEMFRAVVAMYPMCRDSVSSPRVPTLVLIGEYDDWTPAGKCEALAARSKSVSIRVYPSTAHHFDDPRYLRGKTAQGHVLQYNEKAALDAHERALRFLDENMGGK